MRETTVTEMYFGRPGAMVFLHSAFFAWNRILRASPAGVQNPRGSLALIAALSVSMRYEAGRWQ